MARSDFETRATGDNLTSRGDDTRKKLAALIREHVKTAKRVPAAQRWFAVLAAVWSAVRSRWVRSSYEAGSSMVRWSGSQSR